MMNANKQKEKTKALNFFQKLFKKYNEFCSESGLDQGSCRSCTPIVKYDEKTGKVKQY